MFPDLAKELRTIKTENSKISEVATKTILTHFGADLNAAQFAFDFSSCDDEIPHWLTAPFLLSAKANVTEEQSTEEAWVIPKVIKGSWELTPSEITDLASLVEKLRNPQCDDHVSRYINRGLTDLPTFTLWKHYKGGEDPQLRNELTDLLNCVLRTPFYTENRFMRCSLSFETKRELTLYRPYDDPYHSRIRLNRLLLQDAYPKEIAKKPLLSLSYNELCQKNHLVINHLAELLGNAAAGGANPDLIRRIVSYARALEQEQSRK